MKLHEYQQGEHERQWVDDDDRLILRGIGDCWNCRWPMAIRGVPTEIHFCNWVCRTEWEIERLEQQAAELRRQLRISEAVGPRRREGLDRYDPGMGMET